MSYPELEVIEKTAIEEEVFYPYIPTLLTFREAPVLLKCFKHIHSEPDVIIFDGQGILHPRSMGLATHMGIILDKPAIGCAKSPLTGKIKQPAIKKGSCEYITDKNGRVIGASLRTRDNVKPVYVSIGQKIDLENALKIVISCATKYRIPEPLRYAHNLAGKLRKSKDQY